MDAGRWVLLAAVVVVVAVALWRSLTDGRFRGSHRVRGGLETGTERPPRPTTTTTSSASVLAGTAYDAQRGERATLLQFSSAFCAPCRATRRVLADVAT